MKRENDTASRPPSDRKHHYEIIVSCKRREESEGGRRVNEDGWHARRSCPLFLRRDPRYARYGEREEELHVCMCKKDTEQTQGGEGGGGEVKV